MTDAVDQTLKDWRAGAFVYGQTDCMLSIGRYLALTGHEDVTGRFIGQYDTHEGAQAMMEAHGGVPGLMALAGAVKRDGEPCRDDVVEVLYRSEDGSVIGIGALCTGDFVALRLERDVVEIRLRFIRYRGVWHGHR